MSLDTLHQPPDPEDMSPKAKPPSVDETAEDTKAVADNPLTRLQADLEAAKAESEQLRDRFLRKAAELENFRKRTERERAEGSNLTKGTVLIEFLPILDACERALKSFQHDRGAQLKLQNYREGVELLYKQLSDTLNRLGVVPFETKGQQFDPHLHEALSHLESSEFEDNTVIEELRRGYRFKERLLRPAQVIVASRPKPKHNGPDQ